MAGNIEKSESGSDTMETAIAGASDPQMYQETPRGVGNKFQPVVITRSNLGSREWTEK